MQKVVKNNKIRHNYNIFEDEYLNKILKNKFIEIEMDFIVKMHKLIEKININSNDNTNFCLFEELAEEANNKIMALTIDALKYLKNLDDQGTA
jgi:hypothetical protein